MMIYNHDSFKQHFPLAPPHFVTVRNCSGEDLLPLQSAGIRDAADSLPAGETIFDADRSFTHPQLWGITAERIPPGNCGILQIAGVARAFLPACRTGDRLNAATSGLQLSESGTALVLAPGSAGVPGTILLGNAPGAESCNGQFKVVKSGKFSVTICDGSEPGGSIAGVTDLPGYINVPKSEISFTPVQTSGEAAVYFAASWDEEASRYNAAFFIAEQPPAEDLLQILASVSFTADGITRIRQLFNRNSGICFSAEYILL